MLGHPIKPNKQTEITTSYRYMPHIGIYVYIWSWYLYSCIYTPGICIPVSIHLVSVSLFIWSWYLYPCIYTPSICIPLYSWYLVSMVLVSVSILLVFVSLYLYSWSLYPCILLVSVSLYYDLSKAFDSLISGLGVIHSHNIYIIIFYYHHSYFKLAERDCSLILSKP